MAAQMIAAASQQMFPPREVLRLGSAEEGGVVEKYNGLYEPQRTVLVSAKMQLMKLLATTILPTPTTGRKLRAQLMQQRMIQPGRAGGLATTFYQLRITWFTKTFLKMKQPSRQQNSTSVQPTMSTIPTPQPRRKQCMTERRPLTLSQTLVPRQRVRAQRRRSKAGQRQMRRKTALMASRELRQRWQRVGRRSVQMTQRAAMRRRGMRVLRMASLVRLMPQLLTSVTVSERSTKAPQQIHSFQKLEAQIVRRMSMARRMATSAANVTILIILLSWCSMRWSTQMRMGPFQSTQEQTRDMAVPRVSKGLEVGNMLLELAQVVVSTQELTVKVLQQQIDACRLTALQSMAQMPILIPTATRKATQWRMQPAQVGQLLSLAAYG